MTLDYHTNHAEDRYPSGRFLLGEYILPRDRSTSKKLSLFCQMIIQNIEQIIELVAAHEIDVGIIEGSFQNENYIRSSSDDEMYLEAPNHPIVVDTTKVCRSRS